MAPGRYKVFLFDSDGSLLLSRNFGLTPPPSPVLLEVRARPPRAVAGCQPDEHEPAPGVNADPVQG